jgi:hypothetical protein
MPTKRTPLERRRLPILDDETLTLFVTLETTPPRERRSDKFKQRERELHERLGLAHEWFCSVCSVLDARSEHHRPGSLQVGDFKRMREVRLALLAEARARGLLTAAKPASTAREPRAAARDRRDGRESN